MHISSSYYYWDILNIILICILTKASKQMLWWNRSDFDAMWASTLKLPLKSSHTAITQSRFHLSQPDRQQGWAELNGPIVFCFISHRRHRFFSSHAVCVIRLSNVFSHWFVLSSFFEKDQKIYKVLYIDPESHMAKVGFSGFSICTQDLDKIVGLQQLTVEDI